MVNNKEISSDTIKSGPYITPLNRLKLYSPDEWEEFTLEYTNSFFGTKYLKVEKLGGAGDMGRDVIGIDKNNKDIWDSYQCNHYQKPIAPSDVWIEFGKLIYYTFIGEFNVPRKYYFIAPQGVGTKLSNLLKKTENIRENLINEWNEKYSKSITKKETINLDDSLLTYINNFDFSIFDYITPNDMIEQHSKTRYFAARFGGGLPARPEPDNITEEHLPIESEYLNKLLEAYIDYTEEHIDTLYDLTDEELIVHYKESRVEFFSAESLKNFTRDSLPAGEFEKLQKEVYNGIKNSIRKSYPNGYERVLDVIDRAQTLPLDNHSVSSKLSMLDRGGICHQLANDKESIRWVKNE